MAEKIEIDPSLVRWALGRTGRSPGSFAGKFPRIGEWLSSKARLTFVELERLAEETHTPLGFFFLDSPPAEDVPIPDFRTVSDDAPTRFSPDLHETLNAMYLRQSWLRNFAQEEGWGKLDFVGELKGDISVEVAANRIRARLGLDDGWASCLRTWDEAVSLLREKVEGLGILIVINGCVGNNTHRVLNPEEFRGFVISDEFAPLVFVNGRDSKSAQVFTIVHELAHLWVNRSGIFDAEAQVEPADKVEKSCNEIAAEALVPASQLQTIWYSYEAVENRFELLARHFKVSPIVVARRVLDLSLVSKAAFLAFYNEYTSRPFSKSDTSGGSFYNNQNFRIGKRFMRIVGLAASSGRITFAEAYRLTGLTNVTFEKYLKRIGGET